MKKQSYMFCVLLLLTSIAWAQSEEENQTLGFSAMALQNTQWADEFNTKSMDELKVNLCAEAVPNLEHKQKGVRQCADGSVSFVQPDSTGINGWEGKCGQTAAANLLYSYCKMALHPTIDIGSFFKDPTPGILPVTLKNGLNNIFDLSYRSCPKLGEWKRKSYGNSDSYIANISRALNINLPLVNKTKRKRSDGTIVERTPVAVLIYSGGGTLHWITVIDIIKNKNECTAIYQEYGLQKEVKCSELTYSSYQVGLYYGPALSSYTVVEYEI